MNDDGDKGILHRGQLKVVIERGSASIIRLPHRLIMRGSGEFDLPAHLFVTYPLCLPYSYVIGSERSCMLVIVYSILVHTE